MSDKRTAEEGRFAGLALAEEELVARVAWCYYHDGLTQNDIGERLGLPRLKISRLMKYFPDQNELQMRQRLKVGLIYMPELSLAHQAV